jgi:predicted N-formylglutamate amidohydrolase
MEKEKDLNRVLEAYQREIRKDHINNEIEKQKFARQLKNGLGDKLSDINTYIKKEPSIFEKIKTRLSKFFKYI